MNNIEILEEFIEQYNASYPEEKEWVGIYPEQMQSLENLIQENKELNEKYKRLSIEAQATAFDDMNKDTEGLLRVLLKQGEITLDEKGYYQRKDFDWEENLTMMGLMKKREKNFYIPDDSLDEYIKQLENQLKEYNEMKEIFKKYYVMGNETMYDGCCKMQDEIDELKEENKELKEKVNVLNKIKEKIKELEKRKQDLLQLPDDCARTLGLEDCDEKIILYKELLEKGE